MSRAKGYKCFNIKCGSCIGKTLCGEPEDTALVCVDRVIGKPMTNADRIRAMSDMELAQWMASRIANLKFLDIEMSGKQLTATEKAALTHDLYAVFGRYLQQPAEGDDHA